MAGKGKPEKKVAKPAVFRSREGKGNHLLTSTESKDKNGKKVITYRKTKPGNSNN
jgi:hypothetical protein